MAEGAVVGSAADPDYDFNLGALLSDEEDSNSLFGDPDNDDQSSPFTEDGVSAPGAAQSAQTPPDEPFLFLPPPPDPVPVLLPSEPQLPLPSPPSGEVRASEAQDVSTFLLNGHPESALNSDHALAAPQESQTIDNPQVADTAGHDAHGGPQTSQSLLVFPPVYLRPRAGHVPPPRVDIDNPEYLELVPWLQLCARGALDRMYEVLDLPLPVGRRMTIEAKQHLENPLYIIILTGSQDPKALHTLKVTLILSAFSLLRDERMGEKWFGSSNSEAVPRSQFVWPRDASELVLLFAAFIYKLTKNEQQRVYVKNIRAARKAARKEAVEGNAQNGAVSTSESEASGSASPSAVDLASNSSMAASQFPGTGLSPSDAIDLTAVPEQGLLRPLTPPELTYASPQTFRADAQRGITSGRALQAVIDCYAAQEAENGGEFSETDSEASETDSEAPESDGEVYRPAKRQQTAVNAVGYLGKVPSDAKIIYALHFIRNGLHVLPMMRFGHSGGIRSAGLDHIMARCSELGLAEPADVAVEVLTPDRGLERIPDNDSWDRAVCKVYCDALRVVTVCIRLP